MRPQRKRLFSTVITVGIVLMMLLATSCNNGRPSADANNGLADTNTTGNGADTMMTTSTNQPAKTSSPETVSPPVTTVAISSAIEYPKSPENAKGIVDVYIIAGQSNAEGCTPSAHLNTTGKEYLTKEYPDVMFYQSGNVTTTNSANSDKWMTVKCGCGSTERHIGLELGMAEQLSGYYAKQDTNNKVALVKYTWGGTAMYDLWLSETSVAEGIGSKGDIGYEINGKKVAKLYYGLVQTVTAAVEKLEQDGYAVRLRGLAWMQGENDSLDLRKAKAYEKMFRNFVHDIRQDLGISNLPIVTGEIGSAIAGYEDMVRDAQRAVVSSTTNCNFIETDDIEMGYFNWWHFAAPDMIELGRRFAATIENYHNTREIVSVEPVEVCVGVGAKELHLPQFVTVTEHTGRTKLMPAIYDMPAENLTKEAGVKTVAGKVVFGDGSFAFNAEVSVSDRAVYLDGELDERFWENAVAYETELKADNDASLSSPVTVKTYINTGADGFYVAFDVADNDIQNQSYDDPEKYDTIDIYLAATGDTVKLDRFKSLRINVGSNNLFRVFSGNGRDAFSATNIYETASQRALSMKRAVKLHGTPNQSIDVDQGYTIEVFIPYSACSVTDPSQYRIAFVFHSRNQVNGKTEIGQAILSHSGTAFALGNPSTWLKGNALYQ